MLYHELEGGMYSVSPYFFAKVIEFVARKYKLLALTLKTTNKSKPCCINDHIHIRLCSFVSAS